MANLIKTHIETLTGFELLLSDNNEEDQAINIKLDNSLEGEEYIIHIDKSVLISAGNYQALSNASASLIQLLIIAIVASSCGNHKEAIPRVSTESVEALAKRLLPDRYDDFVFKKIESENGSDFFEVQNSGSKILIKGNTGVALATGFKWYLEEHCNSSISLNYNRLDLPKKLPKLSEPYRLESPFEYRYIFNYCTYGYTMPWWDWDRWEDMIDYMALMGVNMPLATIGQEAVWQEVYLDMGLSQQQIDDFFVGPAHLPWGWMGNIDSIGGPLPQNWIRERAELQKKILGRTKERPYQVRGVYKRAKGDIEKNS